MQGLNGTLPEVMTHCLSRALWGSFANITSNNFLQRGVAYLPIIIFTNDATSLTEDSYLWHWLYRQAEQVNSHHYNPQVNGITCCMNEMTPSKQLEASWINLKDLWIKYCSLGYRGKHRGLPSSSQAMNALETRALCFHACSVNDMVTPSCHVCLLRCTLGWCTDCQSGELKLYI